MDPTACYRLLVEALDAGEWDEAENHAMNLGVWINNGGFWPEGTEPDVVASTMQRALGHAQCLER